MGMNGRTKRRITIPVHFYRHYPADYDSPHPASGFLGWCDKTLEMSLDESALVCMHIWNMGADDRLPWGPNAPYQGVMRMTEQVSRSHKAITEHIAPLLATARKTGLPIIHVASEENYALRYPQYHKVKEVSGAEPAQPAGAVNSDWWDDHVIDAFGKEYLTDTRAASDHFDFSPLARPQGEEPVVVTSHQLNAVLRQRGIWNLIYIGFSLNFCLWFSRCGMVDMRRLGYRCSVVRQCTTVVECKESTGEKSHFHESLWKTAINFGYILDDEPLRQAMEAIS